MARKWIIAAWVWASSTALAQNVGRIALWQGTVVVERAGAEIPARADLPVALGDVLRTAPLARVRVTLADSTVLQVGENSRVKLSSALVGGETGAVEVFRGVLRAWVTRLRATRARFEVHSPTAVAGIRGTDFVFRELGGLAQLLVFEGVVALRSVGAPGECIAKAGMYCEVRTGHPPGPPMTIPVALYRAVEEATQMAVLATPPPGTGPSPAVILEQMRNILRDVLEDREGARISKDMVKLDCLQEKLVALKALLRVAEQAALARTEAQARGDAVAVAHEEGLMREAHARAQRIRNEARGCIGESAIYTGPVEVQIRVDPEIPDPFSDPTKLGPPVDRPTDFPPLDRPAALSPPS